MRRLLAAAAVALLSLAAAVSAQSSCDVPPTCSASPAVVPTAWYNLTFPTAPSAAAPTFTWEATDSVDTGCAFVHRGLAKFAGGTAAAGGQFIDLNAPVGAANSSGFAPLPRIVGGLGTGRASDGTAGWSFEYTFRSGVEAGNAKIFAIGAGQAVWNIFSGPEGGAVGLDFGVYGGNGNYNNGASGIVRIIRTVSTTQWYHVVVVVQNLTSFNSDDGAAWFVYVNNQLLNYTGQGIYLNSKDIQPVARPLAYLAKSDWTADPYWTGIIDTFRIYDKALTASQVQTLYNGEMGGCAVPTQSTTIQNDVSYPNMLPRTATGAVTPIYSLTFDTNPCPSGSTCQYGWEQVSATDSSTQQGIHRGMLTLDGLRQYADLNAVSGPLAVSGTALPQIGGGSSGWSFELVMKLGIQENWGKILDIGSTRTNPGINPCNNDVVLGWDANNLQFQFDVCDAAGREYQTGDAMGTLISGAWYHMVIVAQPVLVGGQPNGLANYLSYVNGELYTAEANYPMFASVPRQNAWLGRSGWYGYGDANFSAEVDAFKVYNVALSDVQIAALATAALGGSGPSVPSTCGDAITCPASPATVPAAWYNLTFATNPGASGYGWEATDAGDAGCPFVHRGIATFSGGTAAAGGQYANLNNATGPYGVGTPLPALIGGAGSGSLADGTQGWSFEWTFRTGVEASYAKIFSIGAGEAIWNIFAGPNGGATGVEFGVYGGNGNYANGASGIVQIINPYSTTRWYHVVAVAQTITARANENGAAWFVYVNGALLNYTASGIYLNSKAILAQPRLFAYLAKSDWAADPYWTGIIDTFRIYDRALTQSQVTTLYSGEMGGCAVPVSSNPTGVATPPNIQPRPTSPSTTPDPFYSLTFDANPCKAGSCNYAWEAVSPLDEAAQQALHKGILRINMDGSSGHYVDMGATSGPLSASATALPVIGGVPSTTNPGWSFEIVVKPGAPTNWAKIFDIGSTRTQLNQCNNDIVLGWDANNAQWQFDVCDSAGREFQTGDAFGVVASAWHHLVAVITPVYVNGVANGLANYFTYFDGQLYTAEANYPLPPAVTRQNAWLGLSGWYVNGDANFSGEVDLFNIYNVALTDTQIAARAAKLISVTSCTAKPACSSSPAAVPTPFYELTFATNPVAGQSAATYTWQQSVATDSTCSYQHQGVATFAGGARTGGQYVDLSQGSGPSTGGAALTKVVGGAGAGSVSDGTAGWSFEFTFLSGPESVNAKIFAMGAGEAIWNIFAGPDGNGIGANFGVYGGDGNYANGASGIVEFVNPISTSQWYHVVAVVQQVSTNVSSQHGGAYWIYVNGALLNFTGVGIYLNSHTIQARTRQMAYLAKSTWQADPYWQGAIDTFRIYDRALTQSQVTSLYQGEMGGCSVPFTASPSNVQSPPNMLPRSADVLVTPWYALSFPSDPRTAAGVNYAYGWENVSVTDSAGLRNLHRGIVTLNGADQWIDLNAVSGPYSASTTALPVIGGGDKGWTFEVILKPGAAEHWAKLFDIGATRSNPGVCNNDIAMGWDADTVQWQFDVCDSAGREHQTGDAFGNIQRGEWYHLVAVIAPTTYSSGLANYYTYVNGQLYTVESNFQYPPAVTRQNAWLGRSGWYLNNDFNFSVELDTFNIYNVALSDVQVGNVYQQNFLGQAVQWGINTGNNGGGGQSDSGSSSKSGLSGGAIAGIVIGAVVGALVLCALCWVFMCTGARGGAKKAGSTGYDSQRDVSQMHSERATDDGEHETAGQEGVELA